MQQDILVENIRNSLATIFKDSPVVLLDVCKYIGQDNNLTNLTIMTTVNIGDTYPQQYIVTYPMWTQSNEHKEGVSFEDFVIGQVTKSFNEMLLKSKPVETPVDKIVSVTKFRESVDTDSLRKYIQATLNLDDSWENRIEFVFHQSEVIEVIVGDISLRLSKECFDNHLASDFQHARQSFEEFVAGTFARHYHDIKNRMNGNTMEHSERQTTPSYPTPRPPFVLKADNKSHEPFISDMSHFLNRIEIEGLNERRLNQIISLAESMKTELSSVSRVVTSNPPLDEQRLRGGM